MALSDIDAVPANPHSDDKAPANTEPAHTTSSRVQCAWSDCAAEFSSMHLLAAHLSNDHIGSGAKDEYACDWRACPQRNTNVQTRYDLITHLKQHTGNRSYLCPVDGCGKVYKRADFLTKHINTHSADNASRPAPAAGAKVKRRARRKVVSDYAVMDIDTDIDTSSSDDAPLALVSASKKRKASHGTSKANICSSDNDDNAVDTNMPYRYYDDAEDARNNNSSSHRRYDGSYGGDLDNDEDGNASARSPAQLAALLESQLAYIRDQVALRKEKLLHIKTKTRRLRLENDILIDALAQT